jgi:pyrroloquinoline quinone biosynthesis protein D
VSTNPGPSPSPSPSAPEAAATHIPLTARPRLWRLARLDFDPVRQRKVLLYPEGAMLLNDTGAEVLGLCDGTRTIDEIATELGLKYGADVRTDVADYLSRLEERQLVSYDP